MILPAATFKPAIKCSSSNKACLAPLLAMVTANGIVAFVSAIVEVRATPPGMLATQ